MKSRDWGGVEKCSHTGLERKMAIHESLQLTVPGKAWPDHFQGHVQLRVHCSPSLRASTLLKTHQATSVVHFLLSASSTCISWVSLHRTVSVPGNHHCWTVSPAHTDSHTVSKLETHQPWIWRALSLGLLMPLFSAWPSLSVHIESALCLFLSSGQTSAAKGPHLMTI